MYNDTMDMKWKDAMKAYGILKPLQHTQNTVKSISVIRLIFHTIYKSFNCCVLPALLKDKFNFFHIRAH